MGLSGYLLIFVAALVAAVSNILMRIGLLKAGGLLTHGQGVVPMIWRIASEPTFDIGFLLYAVAALIWFRIISTERLVESYVILVAVTFISISIGGYIVFREPMPVQKLGGMAVIVLGMALVFRS